MDMAAAIAESENVIDQIKELDKEILKDPFNDYYQKSITMAKKVYKNISDLFDARTERGITMFGEEREIYALCKAQQNKNLPFHEGIFDRAHDVMVKIREMAEAAFDFFVPSSEKCTINAILLSASENLISGSLRILVSVVVALEYLFVSPLMPTIINMTTAQMQAATYYQVDTATVNKERATAMLTYSEFAYSGFKASESKGHVNFLAEDIPRGLEKAYNPATGIFEIGGLRVWLGKNGTEVVVAFSGTDIGNKEMLIADIEQMSFVSTLYMKSVGLLYLIAEKFSGEKRICITGHSLGGGLTTFSLCAGKKCFDNLEGFAYNPAGLSYASLSCLDSHSINKAKHSMQVFMTPYDPVSLVGAKVGYLVTLPVSEHNGHGIRDVKECMRLYEPRTARDSGCEIPGVSLRLAADTTENRSGTTLNVTGTMHSALEVAPYLHYVSLKDCNSRDYWKCFNTAYPSGYTGSFGDITINRSVLTKLVPSNSSKDQAGIFQFFNGTSHTVFNRMLLLSRGGPVTSGDYGRCSTIVYGHYGFGREQFVNQIQEAYISSREAYMTNRKEFEKSLASLKNPHDSEILVWLKFFEETLGVTGLSGYVRTYPSALKTATEWLIEYSSARENLFRMHYKNREPTAAELSAFNTELKKLASVHVSKILNEAHSYSIIKHEEMQSLKTRFLAIYDNLKI